MLFGFLATTMNLWDTVLTFLYDELYISALKNPLLAHFAIICVPRTMIK